MNIYDCMLDESFAVVPNPILMWQGFVDRPSIAIEQGSAVISVPCEHLTMRNRLPRTYRYTHEDQQIINPPTATHPEDRGFEFVTQMVERTVVWPAKAFFEAKVRAAG